MSVAGHPLEGHMPRIVRAEIVGGLELMGKRDSCCPGEAETVADSLGFGFGEVVMQLGKEVGMVSDFHTAQRCWEVDHLNITS